MNSHKIVVLGGGFAGLWSAVGAARMLDKLGLGSEEVPITLVNADPYHCIRVRNYEADLSPVRVPLDDVLGPVGVQRVEGQVTDIYLPNQQVQIQVAGAGGLTSLEYDRLVLALGSQLNRPNIPGLAKYGFDVDTYTGAVRLNAHLQSLPTQRESPGLYSVVIVGAGLTGIETAAEMPGKLRTVLATAHLKHPFHVILVDHNPVEKSGRG